MALLDKYASTAESSPLTSTPAITPMLVLNLGYKHRYLPSCTPSVNTMWNKPGYLPHSLKKMIAEKVQVVLKKHNP